MIVTFFRSSSFNNWDFCPMQYYLTYVCGQPSISGQKAEKGTVTHKVLEILAGVKKKIQDGESAGIYSDEKIGEIEYDESIFDVYHLTNQEVEEVNKSRKNSRIYVTPWFIQEGHTRMGVDFVEDILDRCHRYYKKQSVHKWYPADRRDCLNWTWMAVDYQNGLFDPRKRNVFYPELKFNIELPYDWATYNYKSNGKEISGQLGLKGTIDLITKIDDDSLEVVDWKTGSRKNWATGERKTYEKLCNDNQLMLYFYALHKTFPHIKNILITIFFIRDGGPFTIPFTFDDVPRIEDIIRQRFDEIRRNNMPPMCDPTHQDMKCSSFCHFYKNKFTSNDHLNMCDRAKQTIEEVGFEQATKEMTHPDHEIGYYEEPG